MLILDLGKYRKRLPVRISLLPLAIALVFPLVFLFLLSPTIDRMMLSQTEDSAFRVAEHVRWEFEKDGLCEAFRPRMLDTLEQFDLHRIWVLSPEGNVIFSTDGPGGGESRSAVFAETVSKGIRYSALRKKGSTLSDGSVADSDIVEAYLPMMKGGQFAGAVAVHYDMSRFVAHFGRIKVFFSLVFYLVGFVSLYVLTLLSVRALRQRQMKEELEDKLSKEQLKAQEELAVSEKKYRDIIELSPDIIYRSDANGMQTYMNDAAFKILGYEPEEIIGKPFIDLIHPEDREKTFKKRMEMLEKGIDVFDFENRYITKSGEAINVLHNVRVMRDENGNPAGTQGIARDITGLKRREDDLKLFSAAIEETIDGVQIVDLEGRIMYSNRAIEDIYGFTHSELRGRNVAEMNADPELAEKTIMPAMMAHGRWSGELMVKHKNGGTFPIWLTAAIVRNVDEVPIAMVGVIRDMTEKRAMESQLLEYHRHLEELVDERTRELKTVSEQLHQSMKMEAVGQLAGGIAHDFNNRLAAIMNYLSVLRTKMGEGDPSDDIISRIQGSVDKAAGLTRSLLAFSSKQAMNMKPVNLNAVIRDAGMLLERLIGEDIELRMMLAGAEPTVMADENQIENVLVNLATNARDAMPEGGVLTISTVASGDNAIITVTDTGTGMDEGVKRKIFEPFFTTKEQGKGTGLGLSIVYGIMKQHEGRIEVDSWPGGGSTFRLYLPIAKTDVRDEALHEQAAIGGDETILLVEDDADVRRSTRQLLEGAGYTVIEAKDGLEALAKFEKGMDSIDLLILDIVMPRLNGKVVCERAKDLKPGVRALFMSGYTAEFLDKKCAFEGMDLIPKPISSEAFLRRVRKALA